MAMGPIHALPPELLANIFLWYTTLEIIEYEDNITSWNIYQRGPPRPYSWLKIRHVCRLWRNIALSTPALFSQIVVTRQDCIDEMLRGSGDVPLRLISGDQRSDTDDSLAAYSQAFSQFYRVTQATILLTEQLAEHLRDPDVFTNLKPSALKKLYIGFYNINYHDLYMGDPLLAGVEFPALRNFTLQGGRLSLFKPMLSSNLRYLFLKSLDYSIPSETLAMYLQGLQNLIHFVIVEAVGDMDVTQSFFPGKWTPQLVVTLPELRRLEVIESHPGNLFRIFTHLIYPASTYVTIGSSFDSLDIDPEMITHTLIPKLRGDSLLGDMPTFLRMTVEKSEPAAMEIKLWGVATTSTVSEIEESATCTLRPFLELLTHDLWNIEDTALVLSHLPLHKVLDLHVSDIALTFDAWRRLSEAVPSIQYLTVEGSGPCQSLPNAVSAQRVLPHLQSMCYDLSWSSTPVKVLGDLADALKWRRGFSLDSLTAVLSHSHDNSIEVKDRIHDLYHGLARSIRFESRAVGS